MRWCVKRESYKLTWKAKFILLILLLGFGFFIFKYAHSFLAPNSKQESRILVVEGWLHDDALKSSLELFRKDNYDHLFITGGPLNSGYILMNYKSTAQIAYETLLKLGASSDSLTVVSRDLVWTDRTYTSAIELKKHLQQNYPNIDTFNLVSLGAHSRRSWVLFEKAMPEYTIGIISIEEKLYDTQRWWATSKGFRTVFTEGLGYFYVKFFFYPN